MNLFQTAVEWWKVNGPAIRERDAIIRAQKVDKEWLKIEKHVLKAISTEVLKTRLDWAITDENKQRLQDEGFTVYKYESDDTTYIKWDNVFNHISGDKK